MLRKLHSTPGLIAALLLLVVALTGSVLSVFPALERAAAKDALGIDVATLAGRVTARVPDVETLVREPSGTIVAYHLVGEQQRASIIDPASGEAVAAYQPSAIQRWVKNLHRKLLLDDAGRVATGVAAACMLVIVLSGLTLLARRMGGWKQLSGPVRGNTLQRLHNETSRVALAGLVLSAATGLLMSLATFGLIPEGGGSDRLLDVQPSAATTVALDRMPALQAVDVSRLRQLKLATPGDPGDVIELETTDGAGAIDPATGTWLAYDALDGWQRLHATVRMLHTGDGLWWLGLLLGASSLAVPAACRDRLAALAASPPGPAAPGRQCRGPGRRYRAAGRQRDQHDLGLRRGAARGADTRRAAGAHGTDERHRGPLSQRASPARPDLDLWRRRGARERAPVHGQAGPSAGARPAWRFAVLGFGDRQFAQFCGFAHQVHAALAAKGFEALREPGTVDRQSEPEFRQWCEWLGKTLGVALDIQYTPLLPRTTSLKLVSRTDYGADPQTLAAVLRFVPAAATKGWRSWLGCLERCPRSRPATCWASSPRTAAPHATTRWPARPADGVVEICVRRHLGGVCSSYLTGLQPEATIEAFVRPHASFRPAAGDMPVILIGAGTGIGPLIGFIRHNAPQRPMYLYFGARDAEDGFLYREELHGLVGDRRLRVLDDGLLPIRRTCLCAGPAGGRRAAAARADRTGRTGHGVRWPQDGRGCGDRLGAHPRGHAA